MSGPAVRLTDVSKKFRIRTERRDSLKERAVRGRAQREEEFWALRDASFEVPRGSCFGIVGHNGSGKSTTLKVLAGIYRPTSGQVEVNGRMSALLELGAGFHPELTGRENIQLNGAILGMTRSEIDAATDGIIEFAGIEQFIDMPVKVYSSGMYVRLGFSIAIAVRPEILIVDEVIAVGDEQFQRKCFDHFHDLRRNGSTVIMVSHSLAIVSDLCDEAVWIDHGRIAARGDARTVVRSYVDSVNAAAGRTDSGGRVHHGSGDAAILGLDLLDASGEVVSQFVTGQAGSMRVRFESHRSLERAVVGLNIYSENGVNVAGPTSSLQGVWEVPAGQGVAEFSFDELLLTPGTYEVSVGIAEDASMLDMVERGYLMRVRNDAQPEAGLVRMPGQWRLRSQT